MPTHLTFRGTVVATCTLALMLAGGCPWLDSGPGPSGDRGNAKLVRFESPQALLQYFKQQANARAVRNTRGLFGWLGMPTAAPDPAAGGAQDGMAGAPEGGAAGESFSGTNLQELGVDESDVFKSDGRYFYLAKEHTLSIVRATPPDQMAEVKRLDLGMYIDSLYLFENTVIALGTDYGVGTQPGGPEILIWPPYYRGASVQIVTVDVQDPAEAAIVAQATLDGALVSSRLIDDRLIVVLTIVPNLPENATTLQIGRLTLDDIMPKMRLSGVERDLVEWQDWYRPTSPDGYYMTAVVTLDAANIGNQIAAEAVLANAGTIYASTEALYVTDATYDPQDNFREATAIHKFAFDENGAARYVASGGVPGRLLNQFSLGEHEGHLRVATHISNFDIFPMGWSGIVIATPDAPASGGGGAQQSNPPAVPHNGVYVLAEADGDLAITGFVDGLGPNEQIYAARFMGTRGFLVTFEQIDPLFVLDLSDPAQPRVVGELKIPGFSDYLHPLGENHLIGVGNSTIQSPWGGVLWNKLQLSLFDISDLSNPVAVQQLEVGGFRSFAEVKYTHKAFTLYSYDGRTLLALPSQLTPAATPPNDWGLPSFVGTLCFQVDPAAGFTELGRVAAVTGQSEWGWLAWQRAAFIGDKLYALSPEGVRAASVENFGTTWQVELEPNPAPPGGEEPSGGGSVPGWPPR